MKNKIIWIVVAVVVIGGLIWANKKELSSGEVIKIGQMSGLTGIGADIGEEERNGALLAVEEINAKSGIQGKLIEMISEDAPPFDMRAGASVVEKLISIDKVLAIVGPQWDGMAEVVAAISASRQTPTISPNASTDIESKINSPYFFTTWPDNEVGIKALLKFANERGWKKIAVVQPANFSFWLYTTNLLEKNAPDFGIEIVSKEMGTDFNVVDYRTLITKTKSKNPDAIFGSYADLECVFLKQSKELGLEVPLLSTESAGTPKALEECPEFMNNRLYFATPGQSHGYDVFAKSYDKRFGRKPISPSAVTAYNAVLVLADVMSDVIDSGQQITRENIKNGLDNVKFEDGVSMPIIEFNDKGFVITPPEAFEIRMVQDGKFTKFIE